MTKETHKRCQTPLNHKKCHSTISDGDAKLKAPISPADWSAKRTLKITEASNDRHHTDIVKCHSTIENVTQWSWTAKQKQPCRLMSHANIENLRKWPNGRRRKLTHLKVESKQWLRQHGHHQMSLNDRKCHLTILDGDAKLTPLISPADWWVTRTLKILGNDQRNTQVVSNATQS